MKALEYWLCSWQSRTGKRFSDRRIARGPHGGPMHSVGMEVTVSVRAVEVPAHITAVWLSGFDGKHKLLGGRECLLVVVDEHHVA
jgi:hypothetical protein